METLTSFESASQVCGHVWQWLGGARLAASVPPFLFFFLCGLFAYFFTLVFCYRVVSSRADVAGDGRVREEAPWGSAAKGCLRMRVFVRVRFLNRGRELIVGDSS